MSGQIRQADRDRLADQQAQDPAAAGQVTHPRDELIVHAGVHELLQLSVAAKHAERRVPGAEKIPGSRHDLAQHHRQAQLAGHQGVRAQQPAQPPLRGQHVVGTVHQLYQQLIELQPRHVGETHPASRVRGARAAGRRTPIAGLGERGIRHESCRLQRGAASGEGAHGPD